MQPSDPESSLLLEAIRKLNQVALYRIEKDSALQESVEIVQQAFGSGICTITMPTQSDDEIITIACSGSNAEYSQYILGRRTGLDEPGVRAGLDRDIYHAGQIIEKYELDLDGQGVILPEIAQKFGLKSQLSHPLISGKGPIGYLNYLKETNTPFTQEIKQSLDIFARLITITVEHLQSFASRHRLQQLNESMRDMAEARDVKSLLNLILRSAAQLTSAPRAIIFRLNLDNGELTIVDPYFGPELHVRTLHKGQGLANEALKRREPILAYDVTKPEWEGLYVAGWQDTRSELAVPIYFNNAAVRVGSNVERAPKPIGVINVESPEVAAFSPEDAELLWTLANFAGVLIEELETDAKHALVSKVQQTILDKIDWDGTMEVVLGAIKETLGYDFANISLVNYDTGRIKTEYVLGIPDDEIKEFKRLANHPLESNDIQANIVKTRQIEVPSPDDLRFDRTIYDRFGHAQTIRVFMPMIAPSDDRVMGTVEAGYKRSEHRIHIYEQDVQILKGFIDYATRALARRQSSVLERIGHEFRAPVVGIRSHASFLQRRHARLDAQFIERKCEDILIDCEILLSQISQLEHYLGIKLPPPKVEQTMVFRDIIIKTINQFYTLVTGQGLDFGHINYSAADIYKISPIWVDKTRLGQVFSNLLTNSIKYAESDPSAFAIRIEVDEAREAWVIRLQDWGIGVQPEYEDKIFEPGFRTPEAQSRNVTGAGLGLTIAREYMRTMGGDLVLTKLDKPTEFTVVLPKSLVKRPKEVRSDSPR